MQQAVLDACRAAPIDPKTGQATVTVEDVAARLVSVGPAATLAATPTLIAEGVSVDPATNLVGTPTLTPAMREAIRRAMWTLRERGLVTLWTVSRRRPVLWRRGSLTYMTDMGKRVLAARLPQPDGDDTGDAA